MTPNNDLAKDDHPKYALRTIRYQNSFMVNICDLYLIGKELHHGNVRINIKKNYWMQRIVNEKDTEYYLKMYPIANLAGEKITDKAIEMNLAKRSGIKYFSNVPFLMIYRFRDSY